MRLYATMKALFYAPFYAALSLGHFRDEGVDVTFATAPHPDDAVPALLEDRVDVTWGGPIDLMLHHDKKPNPVLVGFCEVVARDPFMLIGRRPNDRFRFQDLVGLKVAPVSEVETPWLCLQEDIRRSGIDPAQFTPREGLTMRGNAAALEKGEFDVIQVFEPIAEDLISRNKGHLWYASASRGSNTYTTLFTRISTIARRASEIAGMVRAMNRTLSWVHAHSANDLASAVSGVFPEYDHRLLRNALQRYKDLSLWAATPVHNPVGFVRLKSAVLAGGWIKSDVGFDRCIDPQIAVNALSRQ